MVSAIFDLVKHLNRFQIQKDKAMESICQMNVFVALNFYFYWFSDFIFYLEMWILQQNETINVNKQKRVKESMSNDSILLLLFFILKQIMYDFYGLFLYDWLDKVAVAMLNLLAMILILDLATIVTLQIIAMSLFWELSYML